MSSSKPTEAAARVAFVTLGCPKNQVDTEEMMGRLTAAGFTLAALPEDADVVVVNTCAFVRDAQRESIAALLALATGSARLIVAGCLAERHGAELAREIPEIAGLLGPGRTEDVAVVVRAALERERRIALGGFGAVDLSAGRVRTGEPHTAYVKIAEGCDHECSFCLIPRLRGPLRSRSPESIRAEMARLGDDGVLEAILVAQDTTAYGRDLPGRAGLPALLRTLRDAPGPPWIRLLYTHPDRWTDELMRLFAEGGRLLPYIDVPIQHCADPVLRAMGRGRAGVRIRRLVERLRARVPRVVLRATVMTGHPGEGAAEFDELLRFLGEFPFDRLGVFAYSPEVETRAASLPRVARREALHRRAEVLRRQREVVLPLQRRRLGETVEVLTEAWDARRHRLLGRSYGEAPEIDGRVRIRMPRTADGAEMDVGEFLSVRVIGAGAYDLDAVLADAARPPSRVRQARGHIS
jgi:ribosomal protein S12 methylthiotransferase